VSRSQPSRPELALGAAGLFLGCWGLVHTLFWTHGVLVDWPTYETYADRILHHGLVPYRDFAVEYPPGALVTFLPPALFGDYAHAFAWEMAACGVALVGVVAYLRPAAAFFVALAPVLSGSLILSRFDLWPALLATAALAALLSDRDALGWALLGAAVSAKLWPGVIVPPALLWSLRRGRTRAPLAGLAVLAVVFGAFAIVAPHGLWASLRGQASRPLQIESLGASFLTAFGHPHVISSHGSQNLAGEGAVAAALTVLQIAAVVVVWLLALRDERQLPRHAAASVCAFVAFGKVLSPQFLLWLIPLVPLVRGRRGRAASALLALALLLTQVWFPAHYWPYVDEFARAWAVLARNLTLVALFAVLAAPCAVRVNRAQSGMQSTQGRI
jgi:uncharacterized membrane protein